MYGNEILQELIADVLIVDLPKKKDEEVAEIIGLDSFIKLASYVNGTEIYIQSYSVILNGEKYKSDNILEVMEKQNTKKFNEEMQELIKIIGKKNVCKLMYYYGEGFLYIPTIQRVVMEARNRKILDEFNGANYRELGIKYDLSGRQIRTIIKNIMESNEKTNNEKDTENA